MSKFIEIHALQSVPASCINRDDSNQPKTVMYGGSLRSRVSSQAWKHAMRVTFRKQAEKLPDSNWLKSQRTRYIFDQVADEMIKQDLSIKREDALKKTYHVFKDLLKIKCSEPDKKNAYYRTKALLVLSHDQLVNFANYLISHTDDEIDANKATIVDVLTQSNSLDLALFGRMVAGDEALNVDAASQVAHAFSVNTIQPEFDYFAAIDEGQPAEFTGAAMLDDTGYNSGTLYRYANVNITELKRNFIDPDQLKTALKLFLKDFALTMPTGKENSYANKTLPNYLLITVRHDTTVNLASSFEKAINSRNGYIEEAEKKLEKGFNEAQKLVEKPDFVMVLPMNDFKSKFKQADNLDQLLEQSIISALA